MLFFNSENQDEIYLNNLPKGRVFKKAWSIGTNFGKVVEWIAKEFKWLVDTYNKTFKGVYICESDYLIEKYKVDYNIPNEIFYQTDNSEHRIDIFVMRYLMLGNTEWHFRAIANIYGINIKLRPKEEDEEVRFDYDFPIVFDIPRDINRFSLYFPIDFGEVYSVHRTLIVEIYRERRDDFVYVFPIQFREEDRIIKMRKIFDIIKPSHIRIEYVYKEPNENELLKFCITGE